MSIEAMKQALEALEEAETKCNFLCYDAKNALRSAIQAAEKQEPVAIGHEFADGKSGPVVWLGYYPKPGDKLYLHPQPIPEWQPIETAPQDETVFLGYRDGRVREAYRVQRDDCEMWVFGGSSACVKIAPYLKPTHWMPKPSDPKDN